MNEYLKVMFLQCESYQKGKTGSPVPNQKGKSVCFLEHPQGLAQAEEFFALVTAQLPVKAILMVPEKVPGATQNPAPPAVDMELLGMVRQAVEGGVDAKLGWGFTADLQGGGTITVRASGRDQPHNPGIDIAGSHEVSEWLISCYGESLSTAFRNSKSPRIEVKFVGH